MSVNNLNDGVITVFHLNITGQVNWETSQLHAISTVAAQALTMLLCVEEMMLSISLPALQAA